ncbi:ABC transporter substrate-binding protein [Sodalis sp. RH21]|uniref:ABC transporter substrate-binding protein n=1 Tax=unclassified Sodalis (in: enterobacteria) TaxID=2636512 RepID=UPI0039B50EF6
MTVVVGAHPQNLSLSILARRKSLVEALREAGITFFIHSAGAQTLPLVRLGAIHLAGTGATPPLLAGDLGLKVAVFGMSGPRPENGGLVVRRDSPFRDLRDLAGKNIALMPISWHQQFLAAELDQAGLGWRDVNAVELLPATAGDALTAGLLDAMVTTDPLYSQLAAKSPLRVLARPGDNFSNRSVYWGTHDVLRERPGAVKILYEALIASDRATAADPAEAARLLDGVNGNSADQWLPALTARPWGVEPPDAGFLAEQQSHADLFAKFGLLSAARDISDTVTYRFARAAIN